MMHHVAVTLLLVCAIVDVRGDGNIGCLFSSSLCDARVEWCYDDHAFGHCLSMFGEVDGREVFVYNLDPNVLSDLETDLRRLIALGYGWSHPFTQCVIKQQLDEFRLQRLFEGEPCSRWENHVIQQQANDDEAEAELDNVAFVRYQPSSANPHADFADEVYFPPADELFLRDPPARELGGSYGREFVTGGVSKKSFPRQQLLLPPAAIFSPLYNTPDKFRGEVESRDDVSQLSDNIFLPYAEPAEFLEPSERTSLPSTTDDIIDPRLLTLARVTHKQTGHRENNEIPELPSGEGKGRLSPKLGRLANLLYQEGEGRRAEEAGAAYTEGGLVFLPNQNNEGDAQELDDGLDEILGLGFKRPERLDVKKPGPQFTKMNLIEQHRAALERQNNSQALNQTQAAVNQLVPRGVSDEEQQVAESTNSQVKKKAPGDGFRAIPDSAQYDVVDTTFAYIGFKQSIKSWHEGRNIVRVVAELLGVPPGTLSHSRVDRNEVTFKVEPNAMRMNSSEVAKRVEGIKEELKRRTGVEVTSAGIGDKTKLPTMLSLTASPSEYELWLSVALLSGVACSVVIAAATLFFLRRNAKSREKLQGLTGPDTEAVGDYQDLCRARMSGKTAPEKPEPIGHRIASLSRESESNNSPSSRSSTSSWSEEPALTNMDISTGHMVLSYMEDHLLNKDRLEQEWVALCAYEAEPCATLQALKPDNVSKNRYAEVVPYDHSRVVLNDLANIAGADYINASTITDHDPRSPAYIATQGPLPQTAPHFWQLVWEQGSVVMVMLTRLTENGNAMCHRYWPEEGSELYHIYEVHLVSEHIWCDDYLVRSFYLKNLKTGETRTVTQFHFLSWPDNGVPTSTKALLEFRRKVNKSYRGRSCPIVVHCSDGVGRTGTYCLIDMVLNRMAKGAKEIDIAATLEHIRDQRAAMVKTKEQFEFVLKAVAEEVNAILKALPPQQAQPAATAPAQ